MTRKTLSKTLLSLAAVVALGGCGGGGLVVGGSATITDSAGTETGFRFPAGVHLNGGMGVNSGSCEISRGAPGVYGVVVDLYGDSAGQGHAVRSMSIMAQTDSPLTGEITSDLGGDEYSATCRVDLTNLDDLRGNVTLTAHGCQLTSSAGTEHVAADVTLDFSGCTVL